MHLDETLRVRSSDPKPKSRSSPDSNMPTASHQHSKFPPASSSNSSSTNECDAPLRSPMLHTEIADLDSEWSFESDDKDNQTPEELIDHSTFRVWDPHSEPASAKSSSNDKSTTLRSYSELLHENQRLRRRVKRLEVNLERRKEVNLLSATVVDTRTRFKGGEEFVEYQIEIETTNRGKMYAWHRLQTFHDMVDMLRSRSKYKRHEIPSLPRLPLFGCFRERVTEKRIHKLNRFLESAANADHLQWGIRVDRNTVVIKRRVKDPFDSCENGKCVMPSPPSTSLFMEASTRLSMKFSSLWRS